MEIPDELINAESHMMFVLQRCTESWNCGEDAEQDAGDSEGSGGEAR